MTRVIYIAILACIVAQAGAAPARADFHTYTFQPTPADLWDLDHDWYYVWGLDWQVPNGGTIVGATLTYKAIDDWIHPEDDHLYTHLLDNVARPAGAAGNWVVAGNDWQDGQDQFAGQGRLLGDFSDEGPGKQDLSYVIPVEYLSWLADGHFGFGIDPDCWYYNDGITLEIKTTHFPAPGAVLLGVIGLGLVGYCRRRFG